VFLGLKEKLENKQTEGCVTTVTLPFTLKSIFRQNKNYGNSNIFTLQKYNLQKIL